MEENDVLLTMTFQVAVPDRVAQDFVDGQLLARLEVGKRISNKLTTNDFDLDVFG